MISEIRNYTSLHQNLQSPGTVNCRSTESEAGMHEEKKTSKIIYNAEADVFRE